MYIFKKRWGQRIEKLYILVGVIIAMMKHYDNKSLVGERVYLVDTFI